MKGGPLKCLFLGITIVLVITGCGKKQTISTAVAPAPPVADNLGPPPTEDEAREFGQQLEAAVRAGDKATVNQLYRSMDFAERTVNNLGLPARVQKGVKEGFANSWGTDWTNQIIGIVLKGGKFTFLRVRMKDDHPRVLIRLLLPAQGGLNYQEIILARFPDGKLGAEDLHIYLTGEMLSQTCRRLILQLTAGIDPGFLARLSGSEGVFAKNLPRFSSLSTAIRQGRYKEALTTYRQLPVELQEDKLILIMGLNASQKENPEEYIRLLGIFRQKYPDDPAIDLMSIDYHYFKKEYDKGLLCLERLNKAVGGDPYLLVLQGNLMSEAGRYPEAKTEIEKAVQQEPTLEEAYWARITVSFKEKNHPDTLTWLKKVVEKCKVTVDEKEMGKNAEYAAFVKSPQFQEFWKWYQGRNK
jgi:tetratricopeptide (TPR) repeat protein